MIAILMLQLLGMPFASADAFKDLQKSTAAVDSYYEGPSGYMNYQCRKGQTLISYSAYALTDKDCKLTEQKLRCLKLAKPLEAAKAGVFCEKDKWKQLKKEKILSKGKFIKAGESDCGHRAMKLVKKWEAKGYICDSSPLE